MSDHVGLYSLLAISWIAAAVLAILAIAFWAAARKAEHRRFRLERWLRAHLFMIRAECFRHEEAIAIVNALERALPVLASIDVAGLEQTLSKLRRERNGQLLDCAGQISREAAATPGVPDAFARMDAAIARMDGALEESRRRVRNILEGKEAAS